MFFIANCGELYWKYFINRKSNREKTINCCTNHILKKYVKSFVLLNYLNYFSFMVPLPKPTSDYSRIIYTVLNPEYEDPKYIDHDKLISSFIHVLECLIREDLCYRFHYILDCKKATIGHIAKIKPMSLKRIFVILEVSISIA